MSAHFDPYHTWLGIPPEEQPADAYRLLGIRRFENNQDVIKNAVEQRQSHIRSFLTGEWATQSQRVLDDLSTARDRLLNPDSKGSYDRELRQKDAPKLAKNGSTALPAKPPAPRKPAARPASAPVLTELPSADPLWEDPLQAQSFSQPNYPYGPPAGAWQAGHPASRPLWQQPLVLGAAVLVGVSFMGVALLVVLVVGWRMVVPGGGARQVTNNFPPQNSAGQFGPNSAPKPPPGQFAPNSAPPNRSGNQGFPSPPQRTPPNSQPPSTGLSNPPSVPSSVVQPKPKEFVLQFGAVPSHVEIENSQEIATLDGPHTIELWARWPEDGKNQTLLGNMWAEVKFESEGVLKPWTGWALCVDREGGGIVRHYHTTGLGPGCNGQQLSTIAGDLRWHHFAYTFDGLGAEAYIDGKRASIPRLSQSAKANPKTNLFLGPSKFADPNRNQFRGEICAFRISSSKRYKQDFEPPTTFDKDGQTITLLDFSQGQGQTIDDLSGQGHAGKITGAKWVAP